jgi:hypothetical protein
MKEMKGMKRMKEMFPTIVGTLKKSPGHLRQRRNLEFVLRDICGNAATLNLFVETFAATPQP